MMTFRDVGVRPWWAVVRTDAGIGRRLVAVVEDVILRGCRGEDVAGCALNG
jgi:hypothetical protein